MYTYDHNIETSEKDRLILPQTCTPILQSDIFILQTRHSYQTKTVDIYCKKFNDSGNSVVLKTPQSHKKDFKTDVICRKRASNLDHQKSRFERVQKKTKDFFILRIFPMLAQETTLSPALEYEIHSILLYLSIKK